MKSIKHIIGDRNTVIMRALIQEVGIKGFGVYWYFSEELHEKTVLEVNDGFCEIYAVVFQLKPEELKIIISVLLKYKLLIMDGEKLNLPAIIEIKKTRSEAGSKGMEKRWGSKKESIVCDNLDSKEEADKDVLLKYHTDNLMEIKPTEHHIKEVDKLEELIKKAIAKTPTKTTYTEQAEEIKKAKAKPTKRATLKQNPSEIKVSTEDFDKLETMGITNPLKDWEFLPLFNEIKLQYKPNSKGNQALSTTDKKNLKSLILTGYTKQDFEKAIHGQMLSKWVVENDMQVPTHILRNDNFVRYLEKSTYKKEFTENLTDQPIYK